MTCPPFRIARILGLLIAGLAMMAGCDDREMKTRPLDVSGHLPALRFRLTDDSGAVVTADGIKGEPVLLYFGYSSCGDICPLTLARLSRLAAKAHFRVLFVSIDPLDRPAGLRAWLSAYRPLDVDGLTGPQSDIADLARRYRAAYRLPAHSQAIYVFDGKGRARFVLSARDDDSVFLEAIAGAAHD